MVVRREQKSKKIRKIHRKIPAIKVFFSKVAGLEPFQTLKGWEMLACYDEHINKILLILLGSKLFVQEKM